MNQSYTAVVKQDGQWWIGWIEEVPGVNCQESTRDELLESLRITLSEALEMNRADAKKAAGTPGGITRLRTSAALSHATPK
jgi:predicted RNase H-like HicB family nuclease